MQVNSLGMVFSKSIQLTSNTFPKENPMLPLPLCMHFDDGSSILVRTPITIRFNEFSNKTTTSLHEVLAWARDVYLQLWKVSALDWFHSPNDAIIDSMFKNPGEEAWRFGFSL